MAPGSPAPLGASLRRTRSISLDNGDLAELRQPHKALLQQEPSPCAAPPSPSTPLPRLGADLRERRGRRAAGTAKWGGVRHAVAEYRDRCAPSQQQQPPPPPPPSLLPGEPPETILASADGVALVRPPLAWGEAASSVLQSGTLHLTSYRLLFVSALQHDAPVQLPLTAIRCLRHKTKRALPGLPPAVSVVSAHGLDGSRVYRFLFAGGAEQANDGRDATTEALRSGALHSSASGFMAAAQSKLHKLVEGTDAVFAHHHRVAARSWAGFDPVAEFERQGVAKSRCWVVSSLNAEWALSPTYPSVLAFPRLASSATIRGSAEFRSRGRLPALSWLHPTHYAALVRSSQPLVGMLGAWSSSDCRMLEMIAMANVHSTTLHVVDARPYSNATGNRGRGGGFEDTSRCSRTTAEGQSCWDTTIDFAGIDNIHTIRASLSELQELFLRGEGESAGGRWLSKVGDTGWIDHVSRILSAADEIAERIEQGRQSVLVHCSDGWDRTAQLTSLAMLLLDPYFRTKRGFAVLVEKEWLAFGHKFRERLGLLLTEGDSKEKERSPVFFQFLDCVMQLLRQFPAAFEFTEAFLLELHDHTLSGLFGTFLYNCERERVLDAADRRTASVWPALLATEPNPSYVEAAAPAGRLRPRTGPAHLPLWSAALTRWLCEPEG